jgi:hypothetical protein
MKNPEKTNIVRRFLPLDVRFFGVNGENGWIARSSSVFAGFIAGEPRLDGLR